MTSEVHHGPGDTCSTSGLGSEPWRLAGGVFDCYDRCPNLRHRSAVLVPHSFVEPTAPSLLVGRLVRPTCFGKLFAPLAQQLVQFSLTCAQPFSIVIDSWGIFVTANGFGTSSTTYSPKTQAEVLKALFASYFIYDIGVAIPKVSALFFYSRIFGGQGTRFRYVIWGLQAANALWLVGIILTILLECMPIEKNWLPKTPGTCVPAGSTWIASAVTSVIIDLAILIAPLPKLWNMSLSRELRFATIGIFFCGYCVVIVSAGRLFSFIANGEKLDTGLSNLGITLRFWLGAEVPISILSICMPNVFFLIRKATRAGMSSLFSRRARSSRGQSPDGEQHTIGSGERQAKCWNSLDSATLECGMSDWRNSEPIFDLPRISFARGFDDFSFDTWASGSTAMSEIGEKAAESPKGTGFGSAEGLVGNARVSSSRSARAY